jgi:hypothetical protein
VEGFIPQHFAPRHRPVLRVCDRTQHRNATP